jgi:hypothetical protein
VEALVGEALVVAEVQVGLGAIVQHEDLAVLERVHRAGVDVDVRVDLLVGDPQAPCLEEATDRSGGDPLPETRRHTPGDEDVFRSRRHLGTRC